MGISTQPFTELNTGTRMPSIGLGTWKLTEQTSDSVAHAIDIGYRMIDTSSDYDTHGGIRKALEQRDGGRDGLFITSKVEEDEDAYEGTVRDLEELGIDRADLILIHRPPEDSAGVELWEGLIRAREEGLTTDIGVSNYSAKQIEELIRATDVTPAVNQVEWSPFGWSQALLDHHREHGIVLQGYSPLTHAKRLEDPKLKRIAERLDINVPQMLIRWAIEHGVVPLPKAHAGHHQQENLEALDVRLDDETMKELDSLNERWSALGDGLPYE